MTFQFPFLVQFGWHCFGATTLRQQVAALKNILAFRGPLHRGIVNGFLYGTHAYAVNAKGAKLLLRGLTSPFLPLDVQIMQFSSFRVSTGMAIVRTLRNLAIQERADSALARPDELTEFDPSQATLWIESIAQAVGPRLNLSEVEKLKKT